MKWQARAACAGLEDLSIFFKEAAGRDGYAEARKVCAICPVKDNCLENALSQRDQFGFLGDKTPKERRMIKAQRRKEARGG